MNSDKRDVRSDFTDVDRANDPGHLVRFLNTVSALEVVRAYKRRSFNMLGLQPGQVVLDLGCGNGDDARELAQRVGPTGHVVGVDRSETLIATARERLTEQNLPVALEGTVTRAQESGLVDAPDGERWLAALQDASAAGRFFGSLTAFIVAGRRS